VSLKGSLDTVALPEVLQLLVDTSKSGELYVRGTRPGGRLWFDTGALCGFEVGRSDEVADALFELLRLDSGEFSFHADAPRSQTAQVPANGREDVRPALRTAQARLEEWVEIVAVLPTLEHRLRLNDEVDREEITLDRHQWSLLVAVGEGHSVHDVLASRKLPEFDGCKAVKVLVDASLVRVGDPVGNPVGLVLPVIGSVPAAVVDQPVVDRPVIVQPVVEQAVVEEPVVVQAVVEEPVVEEPVVEQAVVQEPVVEEPAVEEPAAAVVEEPAVGASEVESGAQDGDASVDQADGLPIDGRAAMQALLAELTPHDDEQVADDEVVDGLQDRGPWTSSELLQMGGWQDGAEGQMAASTPEPVGVTESLPALDDSGSAFHPGSVYDPTVPSETTYEGEAQDQNAYDSAANGQGAHQPFGYEQPANEQPANEQTANEQSGYDEAGYEAEPDEEVPDENAEEPINRGLLLKFLSSVRN